MSVDAENHFRECLLDESAYDGYWEGVSYRCEMCGNWTNSFAQLRSAVIIVSFATST